MFKGVITALATPFKSNGQNQDIDFDSLERLIEHQLKNGVQGFVANGTTAESPTLSQAEFKKLCGFVLETTKKRVPVLFGTGTNNTITTVEKTKLAEEMKADGALVVVPYYNKPPQEGLYLHFKAVAENTRLPVMLYNVPGRTVTSMSAQTLGRLSQIKNVVGIKEASGKLDLHSEMQKQAPKDFIFLSGDDGTCLDFCKQGGHGVISVVSHIAPQLTVHLVQAARDKKEISSVDLQRFKAAVELTGVDTNPIPTKQALFEMKIFSSNDMRLPLVTLNAEQKAKVKSLLQTAGIQ